MIRIRSPTGISKFETDRWDSGLSQPGHEFLNVSNPKNLSERRPKGRVIPEMEVETVRGVEWDR